jgi:Domain of unknown function (DUF4440)
MTCRQGDERIGQHQGEIDKIASLHAKGTVQTITAGDMCVQVSLGMNIFYMSCFRSALLAIAFATVSFLPASSPAAQTTEPDPSLATQLRKRDEILLRAVHTANRAAWRTFAAPDFFYLDEEGGVTYLDAFLRQLAPVTSKPLQIQTYKLTRAGDTAVVLHEDTDENKVPYIFTETWQRLNGAWKLRVLHVANVLSDPPSIQLSQAQIDELAGTYRSESGICTIRREGDRILAKRADGPESEQRAETRDVLFSPGNPRVRKVFLRDAAGKVTGFVVRYESSDALWTKVG